MSETSDSRPSGLSAEPSGFGAEPADDLKLVEAGPARAGRTGPARAGQTGPARAGRTGSARADKSGPGKADKPGSAKADKTGPDRSRPYRFLGITVLALLGLLAMAGVKSYRDLAAAQAIESELQREIEATRARVEALDEHIDRVENDPAMLERIAREELGMVRQGDVVIVLPEASMDEANELAAVPAAGDSRPR